MTNIVEKVRKEVIEHSFSLASLNDPFDSDWREAIEDIIKPLHTYDHNAIFNLGDELSEIFLSTRGFGRGGTTTEETNSLLVRAGNSWEHLVCWYLNLCLAGTRAVAIKFRKKLVPDPIIDSLTVHYRTAASSTEPDIIVLVFPDLPEYNCDYTRLRIDSSGNPTISTSGRRPAFKKLYNALTDRDFRNMEVGVIQCKTNWNDSVQVPMLWDMIYTASRTFSTSTPIRVGRAGKNIASLRGFTYSFMTVPTNDYTEYTRDRMPIERVRSLSGGNYWGYSSTSGVALSIKEIFNQNFPAVFGSTNIIEHIRDNVVPNLTGDFSYFTI